MMPRSTREHVIFRSGDGDEIESSGTRPARSAKERNLIADKGVPQYTSQLRASAHGVNGSPRLATGTESS